MSDDVARLTTREASEGGDVARAALATGAGVGFTPGPWTLGEIGPKGSKRQINAPLWASFAKVVVRMDGHEDNPTDPWFVNTAAEGEANARLITAAPDLYAALKMLVGSHLASCPGEECTIYGIDIARMALAKATGTPSPTATAPSQETTSSASDSIPQPPSRISGS